MKQFERRKGTFEPKRTDELEPGVSDLIGLHCIWKAMWIIEEGKHKGLWAMAPRGESVNSLYVPFSWVPECDINFD